MRKFRLLSVGLEKGEDGKFSVKKGAKYNTVSEMVELEIRNGKRAGSKFIVTATEKDVDRATVDQYIINAYRGTITGRSKPDYVLTYQPAGASPQEAALICTLFKRQYDNGAVAFQGRKGDVRFYLTEVDEQGQSLSSRKKRA
jgi:hypothetical protein